MQRPERGSGKCISFPRPALRHGQGPNLTAPVEESEDDLLDALIAENKVSANLVKKS